MLLDAKRSALLVVDIQERLAAAIPDAAAIIERTKILLAAATRLGVPVVVSEQYPKGLGGTDALYVGSSYTNVRKLTPTEGYYNYFWPGGQINNSDEVIARDYANGFRYNRIWNGSPGSEGMSGRPPANEITEPRSGAAAAQTAGPSVRARALSRAGADRSGR